MKKDKIAFEVRLPDEYKNCDIIHCDNIPVRNENNEILTHGKINNDDLLSFELTENQCIGMLQDKFGIGVCGHAVERSGSYITSFELSSVSIIPKK